MEQSEALKLIELIGRFKLSDEQKNILQEGISQPTLVNACAGSGKTTIFMLTIIYNALIGNNKPRDVLGITFSKKSQIDMKERDIRSTSSVCKWQVLILVVGEILAFKRNSRLFSHGWQKRINH